LLLIRHVRACRCRGKHRHKETNRCVPPNRCVPHRILRAISRPAESALRVISRTAETAPRRTQNMASGLGHRRDKHETKLALHARHDTRALGGKSFSRKGKASQTPAMARPRMRTGMPRCCLNRASRPPPSSSDSTIPTSAVINWRGRDKLTASTT
jgi:hypothetical protein